MAIRISGIEWVCYSEHTSLQVIAIDALIVAVASVDILDHHRLAHRVKQVGNREKGSVSICIAALVHSNSQQALGSDSYSQSQMRKIASLTELPVEIIERIVGE